VLSFENTFSSIKIPQSYQIEVIVEKGSDVSVTVVCGGVL
jgi:hypothetical protein